MPTKDTKPAAKATEKKTPAPKQSTTVKKAAATKKPAKAAETKAKAPAKKKAASDGSRMIIIDKHHHPDTVTIGLNLKLSKFAVGVPVKVTAAELGVLNDSNVVFGLADSEPEASEGSMASGEGGDE